MWVCMPRHPKTAEVVPGASHLNTSEIHANQSSTRMNRSRLPLLVVGNAVVPFKVNE